MKKKRLAILGSTGSIGLQALDIIRSKPELFSVEVLTAANNYKELISQAKEFLPDMVVIANDQHYASVSEALRNLNIKVFAGPDSVAQVSENG